MDASQETTKKQETGSASPMRSAAESGISKVNRGTSPFGQDRKFVNKPNRGDGRFSDKRGRGGFGKRQDQDRPKDDMDSKLLDLSRVSHTRAGGRRLRFRAIVISGNKAGKVGLGVAAGLDVAQAVEKATIQSKKKMLTVPVVNGTISHETVAKVGPAKIMIKPQRKGRGLMAGGVVRLICQLAGVKDISSKMLGTTKNKLNNARATMKAFEYLKEQSTKKSQVAVAEVKTEETAAAEK